ncbi:3'-5' exonuclease [Nocardioides sp. BYT-33-1]|uniref:3'-5' exonuclease n=1 Tax=Nocardioides sp. BYT-33-1 TaxID=3416952 RepID=UPI003F52AD34
MTLCYIDTETTGLDPRIHQPYEVSYWIENEPEPFTRSLMHTLEYADPQALRIGRYFERGFTPHSTASRNGAVLAERLRGVTLVGSNPSFDAAMLTRVIGAPVWNHRMIDVSNVAMVALDVDRPLGLAACADACRERGYDVPEPDHTAEGDVRATRAIYEALREIRRKEAAGE